MTVSLDNAVQFDAGAARSWLTRALTDDPRSLTLADVVEAGQLYVAEDHEPIAGWVDRAIHDLSVGAPTHVWHELGGIEVQVVQDGDTSNAYLIVVVDGVRLASSALALGPGSDEGIGMTQVDATIHGVTVAVAEINRVVREEAKPLLTARTGMNRIQYILNDEDDWSGDTLQEIVDVFGPGQMCGPGVVNLDTVAQVVTEDYGIRTEVRRVGEDKAVMECGSQPDGRHEVLVVNGLYDEFDMPIAHKEDVSIRYGIGDRVAQWTGDDHWYMGDLARTIAVCVYARRIMKMVDADSVTVPELRDARQFADLSVRVDPDVYLIQAQVPLGTEQGEAKPLAEYVREEVSARLAMQAGAVAIEAHCFRCQETFNPDSVDDLAHAETRDGRECGGPGVLTRTIRVRAEEDTWLA